MSLFFANKTSICLNLFDMVKEILLVVFFEEFYRETFFFGIKSFFVLNDLFWRETEGYHLSRISSKYNIRRNFPRAYNTTCSNNATSAKCYTCQSRNS